MALSSLDVIDNKKLGAVDMTAKEGRVSTVHCSICLHHYRFPPLDKHVSLLLPYQHGNVALKFYYRYRTDSRAKAAGPTEKNSKT
jgi:hypothetical protein